MNNQKQQNHHHHHQQQQHCHFNIISVWSQAGIGTTIILESQQSKSRIVFDIGATPSFIESISAKHVFITHGHLDHIGAIMSHARAHHVAYGGGRGGRGGSSSPTYYVPSALAPKLREAAIIFSSIDGTTTITEDDNNNPTKKQHIRSTPLLPPLSIIGVSAGDEIRLPPHKGERLFIRAFGVSHAGHPSLGYSLGRCLPGGLREEYAGLSSMEIRNLVKQGVMVTAPPQEIVEVGYTGDTSREGLLDGGGNETRSDEYRRQALCCPLLFCELTYLEDGGGAEERGHLSIDDVKAVFESHNYCNTNDDDCGRGGGGDEQLTSSRTTQTSVVFLHLSRRYQPAVRILNELLLRLPVYLINRCSVAILSMMSDEEQEEGHWLKKLVKRNGCVSLVEFRDAAAVAAREKMG